ncbi:5-aminolevulinate synthase [Microbulbifer sp. GL-2]|uniref:5-aminolevulinate synthase n=1 Tax=Microbulbifer sp. GL-2 TaxID=2591606 RepID=UPI0011632305|nr:5-aminolevulinate synthase [Microbulbifer sp. GL-2]BBM01966.1 5-aminolevulinate synthase [Microbulbifer sp. GL-2]
MYQNLFEQKIVELKSSGQYREFSCINRVSGDYPNALLGSRKNSDPVVVWCSNDYLGMSQNPQVTSAMKSAVDLHGAGSGGSRNIGGTHKYYISLEKSLADWHGKDAALVFPTGYSSNDATLQCLLRLFPDCVVFSDEKNHASIINGIRSTNVERHIFKHNDCDHLESLLKDQPKGRFKVIVFESIYSMDGDEAPIQEIVNLSKKYNCFTYLDEVHAIGMYGPRGSGIADRDYLSNEIDIIQGTMAKGIGVIGGYITGDSKTIDLIRSFASGFIFTTSLPPAVVSACLASVDHLKSNDKERTALHKKTDELRNSLKIEGIPIMGCSTTHIIPVLIGDAKKCKEAARILLEEYKIYIQPINSPTVPLGTERFRINATPNHTSDQIKFLSQSIREVFNRLSIPLEIGHPLNRDNAA